MSGLHSLFIYTKLIISEILDEMSGFVGSASETGIRMLLYLVILCFYFEMRAISALLWCRGCDTNQKNPFWISCTGLK